MVATDASVKGNQAAWSYVTGAGWYGTGLLQTTNTSAAEWAGICEALRIYPRGASVTVLSDNAVAVQLAQAIVEKGRIPRPAWLPLGSYDIGHHLILDRKVQIIWTRRNTHPLQIKADELCGLVSRSRVEPTAQSQNARRTRIAHPYVRSGITI